MPTPVLLSAAALAPEQRARLASSLFAESRPAIEAASALLAALAVCALRGPWPRYAALAAATLLTTGACLALRAAYQRAETSPDPWAARFAFCCGAMGLMWGATSLAVLLGSQDAPLQWLVLLAQAAWLGTAAARNAASPASIQAQSVCALLPTLAGLILTRPGMVQAAIPLVLLQWLATLATARFLGGQIMSLLLSEQRLAAAHAQLARLSVHDSLTGLANRRGFDTALQVEWGRAAREAADISLLVIDPDHFTSYNKLYRSLAGDDCLRQIGLRVADSVRRPTDLAARFSGARFAALLPGTSEEGAREVAQRLRLAVEHAAMPHTGSPTFIVTISIGVASLAPQPGSDPQVLLALAERALRDAKQSGGNLVRDAAGRLELGRWHARKKRRSDQAGGVIDVQAGTGAHTGDPMSGPSRIPGGLKILVLEDDTMVALLLQDMLCELGCQVLGPCDSPEGALDLLERNAPQIALLDVHLGGGQDAYQVAGSLAAAGVPFAFVTGDDGADLPAEFANRPLLHKPFHLATMVRLVESLAESRRLADG